MPWRLREGPVSECLFLAALTAICQSGAWQKQVIGGAGALITLKCTDYSSNGTNSGCTPPACPSGWTNLGINWGTQIVLEGGRYWFENARQCSSTQSLLVAQPECETYSGNGTDPMCSPPACLGGWTDLNSFSSTLLISFGSQWHFKRTRYCVK